MRNLLRPGNTLRQRVARGSIWVFAIQAVTEALRIARLVVLARLLAPDDFGLMGIALLTLASIESFTEIGFRKALIQKQGDIREYLDTAWTMSGLKGLVLFAVVFLGAPYIAGFFDAPEATAIVRITGLSFLIDGWSNIGSIYFHKELEFDKQFAISVGGTFVDLIVAITMVLILGSVWALVYGLLAGHITRFILSYLLQPYRPRLRLNMSHARELFRFGKWVFLSEILVFLLNEGDDVFLGKILGVVSLGLYQMAFRISNLPTTQITRVIAQVTFPAYSKLQENLTKLREAYWKTLKAVTFLSFPMAAGILILAPDFTHLFLTDKWMPMVSALQLLSILGLSRSVSTTTGSLFQGVGRPDFATKLQLSRLVLMASLLYPFTRMWDLEGTALAVVIGAAGVDPIAIYLAARVTRSDMRTVAKTLGIPLIYTTIMALGILGFKAYVFNSVGLPEFVFLVAFGLITYVALVIIFDRWTKYHMLPLIKEQFRALSGASGS